MQDQSKTVSDGIEALSVSAEFLLCAIRALANGAEPTGKDVQQPIQWAKAKLEQGMKILSPPN
ncbi:hypothetical protein JQ506_07785 [Shinella sp. PSBB067]|uniref:hypothetical protein n=1 Tax=Shinella sp. PSBB067 TaxID=2715959 RepID=UPI00193BF1DA|nr:hypothetical protein [Shinella sp. PSBB067]QRI64881.1 hypothetical protein JQ506_07785 [Shinella sp. PSBB067]